MAADLQAIRTKVRRLTRSPSENMLSTAEIDEYINTFLLYDLPESLRLFSLKRTLSFYTQPNLDYYPTNDPNWTNSVPGLDDFKNAYITNETPAYIAGNQVMMSQSREEFFLLYPITSFRQTIATGDGVTSAFAGTLSNVPAIQGSISFVSVDTNGNALVLEDRVDRTAVNPNEVGNLYEPGFTTVAGTINYITGAYTFTFYQKDGVSAPASGEIIQAQTRPYVAALPQSILYYDNAFTVRPIPDRPYKVEIDAYVRPVQLLEEGQLPDLEQWWQMIAYGAAIKVFQDRADIESVQLVMPEFEKQKKFVLRRTLVQMSGQQSATIYNAGGGRGWNDGYWGNF